MRSISCLFSLLWYGDIRDCGISAILQSLIRDLITFRRCGGYETKYTGYVVDLAGYRVCFFIRKGCLRNYGAGFDHYA